MVEEDGEPDLDLPGEFLSPWSRPGNVRTRRAQLIADMNLTRFPYAGFSCFISLVIALHCIALHCSLGSSSTDREIRVRSVLSLPRKIISDVQD